MGVRANTRHWVDIRIPRITSLSAMLLSVFALIFAARLISGNDNPFFWCWTKYENKYHKYPTLENSPGINDLKQCITECRKKPKCEAIEFDEKTNPKCRYQKTFTYKASSDNLYYKSDSTSYLFSERCNRIISGKDIECWKEYELIKKTDAKSENACRKDCIDRTHCYAVSWKNGQDENNRACWVQKFWPTGRTVNKSLFFLDRACLRRVGA